MAAQLELNDDVQSWVKQYYGEVLASSSDLKTSACCTEAPPAWLREKLADIHPEIQERFYGCGFPIPEALEGATVVDLGCGTGRDVYLLSQLVGKGGHVHGVDMTEEQLALARRHADWHRDRFGHGRSNVSFHHSYIEDLRALPLKDASVDVIVSNCVVNLSPRKDLVLAEAARLLKPGGELYLCDVVADRRLPEAVARDPELYAECLGGALYEQDLTELAKANGFLDPRRVDSRLLSIDNDELQQRVGAARFFSVTYRLFKLDSLDSRCEDYGQLATYDGRMPHVGALFTLDDHHVFEAGRPERVCGNTAAMLAETRFASHFDVVGTREVHYGAFDCSATMAADQYRSGDTATGCC